ncbi:succinate dehydrogenase flavoprotein subunit [Fibrobacteria bacterium R8-3-H12]
MMRQVAKGSVKLFTRREMMDIVLIGGKARGIIVRNLITGDLECHEADAVCLATGGYGNVFYLSTNAKGSNVGAAWRAHKKGALFANPCYTQIHPTCIPVTGDHQSKLTLMSESLRNDGRVWIPRKAGDARKPSDIPEAERYYYLEEKYPSFGNLVPRDVASRNAKMVCDNGLGVGTSKRAVYLDFADAIKRIGESAVSAKYGNLFQMYEKITDENPYKTPMRIYPASHYTMGGLWVDYNLQSTIPGLFVLGEANFSDHGANRLGASALMQGLADGYFVIPYTLGGYFASTKLDKVNSAQAEFVDTAKSSKALIDRLLSIKGKKTVTEFHRELGHIMWENVGMGRNKAGLEKAISAIPGLRDEFWKNVNVLGENGSFNQNLENAMRVADFLEFGELLAKDALYREESCGGHFREEHQTPDNEAKRNDEAFCHVAAWEWKGENKPHELNKEGLEFENVHLMTRSYK